MPAPLKNQYAKKDPAVVISSNLNIRVHPDDMKKWKAAAKKSGAESLSAWVVDNLTREAKKLVR